MAISISEKVKGAIGGKAFRVFEITFAGDEVNFSISAASLGFNYILNALGMLGTKTSGATGFHMPTTSGTKVEAAWATSADASDTAQLWVIGY